MRDSDFSFFPNFNLLFGRIQFLKMFDLKCSAFSKMIKKFLEKD